MIQSFAHKGLKEFWETGKARGINPNYAPKIRRILDALDAATTVEHMDIPGFGLHELKGERAGTWSVKVSGNYRITFAFEDGDAYNVDLEDYH